MPALLRIVVPGLLATFVALAGVFLAADAAKAHTLTCGERGDVLNKLEERYDEKPAAFGVGSDGRMIEVLVGPAGTWTILSTSPTGITCILGSGDGWRRLKVPQKGEVASKESPPVQDVLTGPLARLRL